VSQGGRRLARRRPAVHHPTPPQHPTPNRPPAPPPNRFGTNTSVQLAAPSLQPAPLISEIGPPLPTTTLGARVASSRALQQLQQQQQLQQLQQQQLQQQQLHQQQQQHYYQQQQQQRLMAPPVEPQSKSGGIASRLPRLYLPWTRQRQQLGSGADADTQQQPQREASADSTPPEEVNLLCSVELKGKILDFLRRQRTHDFVVLPTNPAGAAASAGGPPLPNIANGLPRVAHVGGARALPPLPLHNIVAPVRWWHWGWGSEEQACRSQSFIVSHLTRPTHPRTHPRTHTERRQRHGLPGVGRQRPPLLAARPPCLAAGRLCCTVAPRAVAGVGLGGPGRGAAVAQRRQRQGVHHGGERRVGPRGWGRTPGHVR
jgi:hypothetical protein